MNVDLLLLGTHAVSMIRAPEPRSEAAAAAADSRCSVGRAVVPDGLERDADRSAASRFNFTE